jgi:hypothetical protein
MLSFMQLLWAEGGVKRISKGFTPCLMHPSLMKQFRCMAGMLMMLLLTTAAAAAAAMLFLIMQLLWAEGGFKRFYKGFTPCLIRAAPANGAMLYTVDKVTHMLNKE